MNNFTFYSPTLFTFGDGEEKNTGALVRRFGGSRVLLVTGGGSVRRNGAYDAVTASLEAAGIPFTELSDVQANPRSGKVYEGIDLVRRTGADFLLALGGGSVIDTAKAIGFGALYKGQPEVGLPQDGCHPPEIRRAEPPVHLLPACLPDRQRRGGHDGPHHGAVLHQHSRRGADGPAVRGPAEDRAGRGPQGHCRSQ